jgi:hypothetical protein
MIELNLIAFLHKCGSPNVGDLVANGVKADTLSRKLCDDLTGGKVKVIAALDPLLASSDFRGAY